MKGMVIKLSEKANSVFKEQAKLDRRSKGTFIELLLEREALKIIKRNQNEN